MTAQLNAASVTRSIEVAAPLEHAFEVFTTGIGTWWNPEHHILEAGLAEMVFEPRVGGHIIDRGVDGSECRWPASWPTIRRTGCASAGTSTCIGSSKTDPARTSEVEVIFTSDGPNRTRVALTHRHLDRHGEGWQAMRDAVDSGWDLARFANVAAQR
jgi:hypothetical protein